MINQDQAQTQQSFQSNQDDQSPIPYQKSQIKDPNDIQENNSKYSSSGPYKPQIDYRERSRSRENSYQRRPSFHDYRPENKGQNNYNMNNRNNKPYYYRQNNERQFEPNNRFKNERNNFRDHFNNNNYNSNYAPTKDDCLIVLPKNYYNFISKDFDKIRNDLKRELKDDIYNINNNYTLPNIPENIFRFTTNYSNNYPLKSRAIRIIADFLFDMMKRQYENTTYLKLIFLIPDNVIGRIIGISGNTINQIREETNAKVEVFPQNNDKKFRKIEVAGVPQNIADAGEKIYSISRKYFYFNDDKIINRNTHSPQREREWDRERDFGDNNYRDRRDRYYGGDYENDRYNNDKDYKGMFKRDNRERNDYRDIGYKNDYKNINRDGFRNYNGRDNNLRKNSRDFRDKNNNNNYNRDNNNFRDYRNNNQRYRNNYDKGNNNKNYNNRNKSKDYNDNDDNIKKGENWSNQSSPRKSLSEKSREIRSYNNENDGDWPEEKDFKDDENKREMNDQINQEKNNEENSNKENVNLGEEKDLKDNYNNENNIVVSNISNNNLNKNINIIGNEGKETEIENGEIEDVNNINEVEGENGKSCQIKVYLSSEEINLLNNSKYDNIWINLENSYKCTISKTIKNMDDQEINLITFNGTPKQNTLAIYQLQKYLLDIKFERLESIKSDN